MDAICQEWLSVLTRTVFCTTFAAAISAGLLTRLQVRSSRAHQLACLLIVLQGWLVFSWSIDVPIPTVDAPPIVATESLRSVDMTPQVNAANVLNTRPQQDLDRTSAWGSILLVIWVAGAAFMSCRLLIRYYTVAHCVPLGHPPHYPEWVSEWQQSKTQMGIGSKAELRTTEDVGPLLCYVPFAYLVLVPEVLWRRLRPTERVAILKHECAHLSRGDLWMSFVMRMLALPQWFNPAVWWAVRRFDEAAEWACDDLVLKRDGNVNCYAKALLQVAEMTMPAVGAVGAQGGLLSRRIRRLMNSNVTEDKLMKKSLVPCALLILSAFQLIQVRAVAQEDPIRLTEVRQAPQAVHQGSILTDTQRSRLEKAGLDPYIIEPPDVLVIRSFTGVPKSSVVELRGVSFADISGEHLVQPDGSIDLGRFGKAVVNALDVKQAKAAIERQLGERFQYVDVEVDVLVKNSKFVYLIVENETRGDHVVRIPCQAETRVIDALSAPMPYPIDLSGAKITVKRPTPNRGADQVLEVDWDAITRGAGTATNHYLQPGDRVFVDIGPVSTASRPEPRNRGHVASAVPPIASPPRQVVRMKVSIVRDRDGNLEEFKSLQRSQLMLADTESAMGTLRILKKNDLVEFLSMPQVTCIAGESAHVQVDEATAADQPADRIELKLQPELREDSIVVKATTRLTVDGRSNSLDSAAIVAPGKTMIMRTQPTMPSDASDAIYVVVTPELAR